MSLRTLILALNIFGYLTLSVDAQEIINNSHIAYTLLEKDLLPESLAFDQQTGDFFIGSTRKGKVLKVSPDGSVRDFIASGKHGLWMVIGMKIDSQRRHLWVCSSGGENLINYKLRDETDGRPAGIFKFDLDTGELIKSYKLNKKGEVHFFNDIVIARDGSAYITHMFEEATIFKIDSKKDQLEEFASSESITYPNGITIADNGKTAFIAHSEGISKLNLETKEFSQLPAPEGFSLSKVASIDGLNYYKWSLIGIQSDIKQVVRLSLNKDASGFERIEVLERNHPMMNRPTTGEVVNGEFYYIANAQFDSFDSDGNLFPLSQLFEPTILKLRLQ